MIGTTTAIIVAAGKGERFGTAEKVFTELAGRPMVVWSLDAFSAADSIDEIVLVAGEHTLEVAQSLLSSGRWPRLRHVVIGGIRRQDSVQRGLSLASKRSEIIAVHDAARPLIDPVAIDRCIVAARSVGGALLAAPVVDTLKHVEDGTTVDRTVSRDGLWAAQTPQAFGRFLLEGAFVDCEREGWSVTDDASMVELAGESVALVPNASPNFKITTQEDARMAELLLAERGGSGKVVTRTGIGYDVHRFASGRPLMLGGVEIPSDRGLDGHSDADVLLHAVTDAILGAAAQGDIGVHFPPSDPKWQNASSLIFLRAASELIRNTGGSVVNIDATVIAETPKIMSFATPIRESIARALGIDIDAVSVKATTNEGMGFVGREEGIAALAIATVMAPKR